MKHPVLLAALCLACAACASPDNTNVVPYPGTTAASTPSLKTYEDADFHFSFAYPDTAKLNNECGPGSIPCGHFVVMTDTYANSPVTIDIDDGTMYDGDAFETEFKNVFASAKTYAERLHWQNLADKDPTSTFYNENVADKTVGPLEKTTFAGQEAYRFHLTQDFTLIGFDTPSGGYLFDDPSDIIVFKHRGNMFVLRLKTADGVAGIVSANFQLL